jgi:hypothetical protein
MCSGNVEASGELASSKIWQEHGEAVQLCKPVVWGWYGMQHQYIAAAQDPKAVVLKSTKGGQNTIVPSWWREA